MNAAQRAAAIAARHATKRDWNPREEMPECTAFIDWVRDSFGDPACIYAVEGSREIKWRWSPPLGRYVQPVIWRLL